MNTELIKERFTKNLKHYHNNAEIQKLMSKKLISLIEDVEFPNILEIGCGTGFLTDLATKKFKYNNYTANDLVDECKNYISKISSNILFTSGNIENIILHDKQKYNLILSNATFQWIEDLEKFLSIIMSKLSPNGILLFSTFGGNNFKEITEITNQTLKYKNCKYYKKIFEKYIITINEEILELEFKNPKEVLKHIKNTGVNALNNVFWTKADLLNFENKYYELCPKAITLTYNPIYIMVKNSTIG